MVLPTWRMPRPNNTRASERLLRLASIAATSFGSHGRAQMDGLALFVRATRFQMWRARISVKRCSSRPRRARGSASTRRATISSPMPSMSMAPRLAQCEQALQRLRGAVDRDAAERRPRPPRARRGFRSWGSASGICHGWAPSGRSASTGPSTSGMTSPALRTMTVSPTRTSLRCTSSSLCSVARATVEPATTHGIELGHRGDARRCGLPAR